MSVQECGAVSCVAGSCDWGLLPVEGLEGLHKVCRDCSDRIHRRQTGRERTRACLTQCLPPVFVV